MILNAIIKTFFLKEGITWEDFNYPKLQAWSLIVCLGILGALESAESAPPIPMVWHILLSVVFTMVIFFIATLFMQWWMKRKGCDSQGRMLQLVAATALIDIVISIAGILGVPLYFLLPLFLYSLWVAAHALEQVSELSIGYIIVGLLVSLIPSGLCVEVLSFFVFFLGFVPPM